MKTPLTPRTPAKHAKVSSLSYLQLASCLEVLENTLTVIPHQDKLAAKIQDVIEEIQLRVPATSGNPTEGENRVGSMPMPLSPKHGLATPMTSSRPRTDFKRALDNLASIPINFSQGATIQDSRSFGRNMPPKDTGRVAFKAHAPKEINKRPSTPPDRVLGESFVQLNMIPAAPRKQKGKRLRYVDFDEMTPTKRRR
ncbi:hypothetical protein NM208_g6836 [Fusarium decemcellulare]|uniref:Uncharacterized protein n=1 Tax=Fusarium decemcellulare TaxID=57161 RepID=A0ACC1SBV7_9HYPO|nr:hypothetical protein NM208_g6836 [Fusarium decemcellulare]